MDCYFSEFSKAQGPLAIKDPVHGSNFGLLIVIIIINQEIFYRIKICRCMRLVIYAETIKVIIKTSVKFLSISLQDNCPL